MSQCPEGVTLDPVHERSFSTIHVFGEITCCTVLFPAFLLSRFPFSLVHFQFFGDHRIFVELTIMTCIKDRITCDLSNYIFSSSSFFVVS